MNSDIERFEEKFIPEPNSGCWLWTASLARKGYGQFWFGGTMSKSHRVSWVLYVGPILGKKWVLHSCDIPCCVNPSHLFIGTHTDNMRDMVRKGRHALQKHPENTPVAFIETSMYGERNSHARLTAAQVRQIREEYLLTDVSQKDLATRFGMAKQTISDVVNWKKWKHLAP